ncbi:hypothetical protein BTA30_21880 [Bacillus swezeyi]|nr:hypothetical protein BTA30_21880 [Bacillus swezeyi]
MIPTLSEKQYGKNITYDSSVICFIKMTILPHVVEYVERALKKAFFFGVISITALNFWRSSFLRKTFTSQKALL